MNPPEKKPPASRSRIASQSPEAWYKLLFEQHPFPMWVYDLETLAFLAVNDAAVAQYGYSREEFLSMSIRDIRPVEDVARLEEIVASAATGVSGSGIWRHRKKDGTLIDVEITGQSVDYSGRRAKLILAHDITSRLAGEQERALLTSALASVKDCLYVTDLDDKVLFVNAAFEAQYGYRQNEMVGKKISTIWSEKHDREFFAEIRRAVLRGWWSGEVVSRGKDGKEFPAELWSSPIKNGLGLPMAIVGITREITERKRTEQALRESEQRFRNLVESTNDFVWEVNEQNVYTYVSPQVRSLLGYRAKEVVGKTPFDFMPPDEARRVSTLFSRIAAQRKPFRSLENTNLHKYGHPVVLETSGVPIFDAGGVFRGYRGIDRDITDRKQSEENLVKLGKAVESSGEVVFLTDPTGIITFVNPEFTRLYGYEASDVVGKVTPRILKSGDLSSREYATFWKRLLGQEAIRAEFVNLTRDGKRVLIEASVNPVVDEGGSILGFLAIQRDITAQRTAEEEQKSADARFRSLVEESLVGIYIIQDERFQYVNPRLAEIFGYRQEEIESLPSVTLLVDERDRERVLRNIQKRVDQQIKSLRYEFRGKKHDGSLLDLEVNGSVTTFGGKPAVIGTLLDITDRKRAEHELVSLNRALETITACNQALIRASDEVKLMQEICQIIVDVGRYRLTWVGFAEEDKARTVRPVARAGYDDGYVDSVRVSWADVEHGRGPVGTAIRTGESCVVQNILLDPAFAPWRAEAAKRGYAAVIALPLIVDGGTLGSLAIYSEDAHSFDPAEVKLLHQLAGDISFGIQSLRTRREHDSAVLQVREQAALLEVATDAIIVQRMNGVITFWNKGAERLYRRTAADAMGKNVNSVMTNGPAKTIQAALDEVSVRGAWSGELEQTTRDGLQVIVESRWTLMRDPAGKPSSILVVNTDISAKKRLEAQFLRAQRMEGIGTLAGGIAHDLNNVLAPILMAIEILKKRYSDDQASQILSTLESSALRGADMVQQVLAFARGMEGEHIALQPRHLIKEMEKIARETFPKSIQIRVETPRNLWTVQGDATQLHQVLLNLCINARDAMPQGGALTLGAENIEIDQNYSRMHAEAQPGSYVLLKVTDSGSGIPPGIINKIFEPFFTTKELGRGTGLGLSTVHSIVKSHKGFINVYSEVARGTSFNVYIPAVRSAAAEEQEKHPAELPMGNGELILVIDDESSIRQITRETLESYGYKVLVAGDGAEALALFAQRRGEIALVFTDILMPFMDGTATIRALRKIDPVIKIVAASGLASNERLAEIPESGVKAFLQKPYTAEKLLTTIRAALMQD